MARNRKRRTNKKTVSLTVHRNTLELKRRRALRQSFCNYAKALGSMPNISGFIVIGFDDQGNTDCEFDAGDLIPLRLIPELARAAVDERIQELQAEDCAGDTPGG